MNPFHALQALVAQQSAKTRPLQVAPNARGIRQQPMQASVAQPTAGGMPNLGVSFNNVQGGQYGSGRTPLQASQGRRANPQMQAYRSPQTRPFNPQNNQDGYIY